MGSRAGSGHLLLKPGEHVGHESSPSQGSLLLPSLLVQSECVATPSQAEPPHQLSSNLEGRGLWGVVVSAHALPGSEPTEAVCSAPPPSHNFCTFKLRLGRGDGGGHTLGLRPQGS